MTAKKKVLVLGGEGFIGRNLTDVLSGNFECTSVGVIKSFFPGSKADYINIDPYKEKIPGHYDIVIQLIDNPAPLSQVRKNEQKLLSDLDTISPAQIIVFSSAAIYMAPESEYAQRKMLIEDIYQKYCQKKRIGLSVVRLFNIFGPYQLPNKKGSLVANILYKYYANEPIEINDLEAKRDFIYSIDMAKCVEKIIKKKLLGTDDLAMNKMMTIKELLDMSKNLLGDDIKIMDKKNKEQGVCPGASSRIIKLIRPTSAKKALKKTIEFYKDNWQLIGEQENVK